MAFTRTAFVWPLGLVCRWVEVRLARAAESSALLPEAVQTALDSKEACAQGAFGGAGAAGAAGAEWVLAAACAARGTRPPSPAAGPPVHARAAAALAVSTPSLFL